MPALNMIRYEVGSFKSFFERILKKHNQKMKAYVAVQTYMNKGIHKRG
jgi:hypothetical protein